MGLGFGLGLGVRVRVRARARRGKRRGLVARGREHVAYGVAQVDQPVGAVLMQHVGEHLVGVITREHAAGRVGTR